jgi:hypothetical protein
MMGQDALDVEAEEARQRKIKRALKTDDDQKSDLVARLDFYIEYYRKWQADLKRQMDDEEL